MSSGFILPVILGDPLAEAGVNKRYGDVSPTNACCEDIVPEESQRASGFASCGQRTSRTLRTRHDNFELRSHFEDISRLNNSTEDAGAIEIAQAILDQATQYLLCVAAVEVPERLLLVTTTSDGN